MSEINSGSNEIDAAKQTFINYHKAITNKDYSEAYNMLSYQQRERVGNFDQYVAGFVNTKKANLTS
mgnify:CR=1 FL=1